MIWGPLLPNLLGGQCQGAYAYRYSCFHACYFCFYIEKIMTSHQYFQFQFNTTCFSLMFPFSYFNCFPTVRNMIHSFKISSYCPPSKLSDTCLVLLGFWVTCPVTACADAPSPTVGSRTPPALLSWAASASRLRVQRPCWTTKASSLVQPHLISFCLTCLGKKAKTVTKRQMWKAG